MGNAPSRRYCSAGHDPVSWMCHDTEPCWVCGGAGVTSAALGGETSTLAPAVKFLDATETDYAAQRHERSADTLVGAFTD